MKALTAVFVFVAMLAAWAAYGGWWPDESSLAKGVMVVAFAAAFVTFTQIARTEPHFLP